MHISGTIFRRLFCGFSARKFWALHGANILDAAQRAALFAWQFLFSLNAPSALSIHLAYMPMSTRLAVKGLGSPSASSRDAGPSPGPCARAQSFSENALGAS
eukprot:3727783-Pyramimonas_sp.AAC.1